MSSSGGSTPSRKDRRDAAERQLRRYIMRLVDRHGLRAFDLFMVLANITNRYNRALARKLERELWEPERNRS